MASEPTDQPLQGPVSPPLDRRPQEGARRILVIDADRDVRELVVLGLTGDGFTVDSGATCVDALTRVQERRYGLVITDYELPDGTAPTWMRPARRAGLLDGTPVLIATGHPDPDGIGGSQLLRKPFDPQQLLEPVRRIMERGRAARRSGAPDEARRASGVEIVLYVTPGSPASDRAKAQLAALTAAYPPGTFSVVMHDVAAHAPEAEDDQVIFTPALVKRDPVAPVWVLGDLTMEERLADLLRLWADAGHD